jgi:hypothetical protein
MHGLIQAITIALTLAVNLFAYTIAPTPLTTYTLISHNHESSLPNANWQPSVVFSDSAFSNSFWGVSKNYTSDGKVAYSVGNYWMKKPGIGSTFYNCGYDTAFTNFDSTYVQQTVGYWTLDELKAAPEGKVHVKVVHTDSVYIIVSDTLKTTIFVLHFDVPHNYSAWLNKLAVINNSTFSFNTDSCFDRMTVQRNSSVTIVLNPLQNGGWSITNGALVKNGVTYSSPNVYAVNTPGSPVVDYKNNVWFYGKIGQDTLYIKLEAWNNFQNAFYYSNTFAYNDTEKVYVKFLMNLSTDMISGYVGNGIYLYKCMLSHPPTYIGPKTIVNESGSPYAVSHFKAKFHQDTLGGSIYYPNCTNNSMWVYNNMVESYYEGDSIYSYSYHDDSTYDVRCPYTYDTTTRYEYEPPNLDPTYASKWMHLVGGQDSFNVSTILRSKFLTVDSLSSKTLNPGDHYIDTVISYQVIGQHGQYKQYDNWIQTIQPGRHPDSSYRDGVNIYLTSTLPSWITATKINGFMILLEGTVPEDAQSIDTQLSIVDSVIYQSTTSMLTTVHIHNNDYNPSDFNHPTTSFTDSVSSFYRSAMTHLKITIQPSTAIKQNVKIQYAKKNISMEIYNMQGRLISKTVDTDRIPLLTAGSYICKLSVNKHISTRLITMVK